MHWAKAEWVDACPVERERKKAVKAAKLAEEKAKENVMKLIESVIEAANQEEYPTSPEAKEKYFMEQVTIGEALCGKGNGKEDPILKYGCSLMS